MQEISHNRDAHRQALLSSARVSPAWRRLKRVPLRDAVAVVSFLFVASTPGIAPAWSPRISSAPVSAGQEATGGSDPKVDAPRQLGPGDDTLEKPDVTTGVVIVEGQVINHIGAGEPGVTVSVYRQKGEGVKGDLIATAETDKLGDFKVTSAEAIHGDVIVTLSKPKYTETVRRIRLGDEEFPPFLAEELEGNLVFKGRVTDALTGKPLPGASVSLTSVYKDWSATSDDDGRFTVKGVTPGPGQLVVEAESYGREQVEVADIENALETTVRMKPERIVHIKVVDERGRPIARATVEVHDKPVDDFRTLVTGADGTVSLHGVHFDTDTLFVRVTHEDHVSQETFEHDILLPWDTSESTHQVTMLRAGRITGKVTDAESGKPLNGARVMTGEGRSDLTPRDWANYLGEYTITGVPAGPATVTVHLAGFAPELETVEVKAGEAATLGFQLRTGATVTGVVKDNSGAPVSGVNVETTQWRGRGTLGLRAVTGPDGRFVIDSAPHDEFEITVAARRGGQVSHTVPVNREEMIEITLPDAPATPELTRSALAKVGDQAPAITVTTLKGQRLELAKLGGKIVLVDFWATWCGPCVAEIPIFADVFEQGKPRRDFVMISVSLDGDEAMLRRFLKKRKMEWHQVYGEKGGAQAAADRFGVMGLPAVFLIGADGKILASYLRGHDILKAVKKAWQSQEPK